MTVSALNLGGSTATVTVYSNAGARLLRTISLVAVDDLTKKLFNMTASSSGFLYIELPADPGQVKSPGLLTIYKGKGAKKIASIGLSSNYYLLVADAVGNVYTMCKNRLMCEYNASGKSVRKINVGKYGWNGAEALAVDSSGDLAIVYNDAAMVFPPGATKPSWSIGSSQGMGGNISATFDPSGNLYIAGINDKVFVFAPNASSPSYVIEDGVANPSEVVCDSLGNLYVLNGSTIARYAQGESTPESTIGVGPSAVSMALDAADNLYVANEGGSGNTGSVTVYAAGSNSLVRTVTNGIEGPASVGVSP
ncbi:MAG TPA: hypothetical protein VGF98_10865 [Candidatus Tumulicola sp.]